MNTTKRNFWLDLAIFAAFLMTMITGLFLWLVIPYKLDRTFPGFSRSVWIAIHLCCGGMGLTGIVIHIARHFGWLKALRGRPIRRMPKKLRANRLVDRMMWFSYIAAYVCGATAWALHFRDDIAVVRVPDRLHVVFGVVWTILTIAHLALHWKWITFASQRCIAPVPVAQVQLDETHPYR